MAYRLIEDLKQAQLYDLIPPEEEIERLTSSYDPFGYKQSPKMKQFCDIFSIFEDEGFDSPLSVLETPFHEFLNITPQQIKLINQDLVMTPEKVGSFIRFMNMKSLSSFSVEERITLSQIFCYLPEDDTDYIYIKDMQDFRQYLKIAKNRDFGIAVEMIGRWEDYKRLLDDIQFSFRVYQNAHTENDKLLSILKKDFEDEFGPDAYIKPSTIYDVHQKAVRFNRVVKNELDIDDVSAKNEQMRLVTDGKDYKKLSFQTDTWLAVPIRDYDSLKREGDMLDHCVAQYAPDIINEKCMIFALRKSKNPDTPYYTAEIKKSSTPGVYRLTQCFGLHDTISKPESLYNFIQMWCQKKNIKIECRLLDEIDSKAFHAGGDEEKSNEEYDDFQEENDFYQELQDDSFSPYERYNDGYADYNDMDGYY